MSLDICPLQELFQGDEELPIEFVLYYLHKHTSAGVQAFLINKLYLIDINVIDFYLPQLLKMSAQRDDYGAYMRFFTDISSRNYMLGIKLYWIIQSELKKTNFSKKIQELAHALEKNIVQGNSPMFELEIPCDISDFSTIRAEYFSQQFKFAYTLVKISMLLINEIEDKDNTLKAYIKNLDTWLKDTRFWYSRESSIYTKQLFRGIIFHLDLSENIEQVVRIPSEEAKCFKTKARVPYKVILETILTTEKDPGLVEEALTPKPPEDFLDDISIDSDSIVDKDSVRFEGLEDYPISNPELEAKISSPLLEDQEMFQDPWGERWIDTKSRIKLNSPFSAYNSWDAKAIIVKGHDDLRQELLAMQIIKKSHELLQQAQVSAYLRPYNILIVSDNSGIIECVPDSVSLHTIKKHSNCSLNNFFLLHWGNKFEEAQKNFVESTAGYSLLCYLLNLKDRHNGNILLDCEGHIIHIDFGFFLTNSPGKLNVESAPFKLTKEMIDLMGGYQGEMFNYFKMLFYQAFLILRKYAGELVMLLEMMLPAEDLPCFYDPVKAIKEFKARFCLELTDEQILGTTEELIRIAAENWRTDQYDIFQWVTNNILY